MSVFIARKLYSEWIFNLTRQAHTGPSRMRLKRKEKSQESLRDDPYIFHPRVRTVEPVRQALRITKSVMSEGLPSVVLSETSNLPIEDILSQIRHCLARSGESEQHAKHVQRSKGVMMNVMKAVWSLAASYPGLLKQSVSYRPDLKVCWKRFGYNFQVSGRTGILFSSEFALPNFSSDMEVENTRETMVEDKDELISPVFELSQNVSKDDIDSGFHHDLFPFPQTLVITEQNWKIPHLLAQGIMFSFGRLVERAITKDGASFGTRLQRSSSIRSIVYNDKNMVLLCYQLNTLDFDNDEGVKNQLWITPEFPISLVNKGNTKNKDEAVAELEFPQNEFKELVALLLYGEGDVATQESVVM